MSIPAEKDTFSDSEGEGICQCEMSKGNIGSPNSNGTAAGSMIVVELSGKGCLEGFFCFLLPVERDEVAVVILLVMGELMIKSIAVLVIRFGPLYDNDKSVQLSVVSKLECILEIACTLKAFMSYLDL